VSVKENKLWLGEIYPRDPVSMDMRRTITLGSSLKAFRRSDLSA
jgi:hypothetical protein